MNLILLSEDDFIAPDRVVLHDRRQEHILAIHKPEPGDSLRVGLINGQIGTGIVETLRSGRVELTVRFDEAPPEALPLTLLLALPRPKMLKRVLQGITSLGVKNIYLINSYRVDKSFWGSALLHEDKLREQMILGLEQARDTLLPTVHLRQRFKPFVEDELPQIIAGQQAYVAHPGARLKAPTTCNSPVTLAIGPEGGLIPYEVDKLEACGFQPITLGERILRVETAVPVLISCLTQTSEAPVR